MVGAARVCVTLEELASIMELPAGHSIVAVGSLPNGHLPGIYLTIAHGDDVRPVLPTAKAAEPLTVMDMVTYYRWVRERSAPARSVLRPVDSGCADDCTHPSHRHEDRAGRPGRRADADYKPGGYTPITSPVKMSNPAEWPRFPGEGLPITGEVVRGDPGDEDQHMGGPR